MRDKTSWVKNYPALLVRQTERVRISWNLFKIKVDRGLDVFNVAVEVVMRPSNETVKMLR